MEGNDTKTIEYEDKDWKTIALIYLQFKILFWFL